MTLALQQNMTSFSFKFSISNGILYSQIHLIAVAIDTNENKNN